jgi:Rha family phage regulatory protein
MNKISREVNKTIDSREVAGMLGKEHWMVLRDIEGSKDGKTIGIIQVLADNKLGVSDYFVESSYKDNSGKANKCYQVTKMGCEMLGNKQQGEKGILFTAKYVKRFNDMEEGVKSGQSTMLGPQTKEKEIEARFINAQVRKANILLKIAESIPVESYKQVLKSKATEVLNNGQALIPLPKSERKTYSATEIGQMLGITANKVGKLANSNNLKTGEYGELVWDKSKYSAKEVQSFRYYEEVIPVLKGLI